MINLRDGVSTIEQLKPYNFFAKDSVIRYCFFQMNGIVETLLGFDTRGCENDLAKLGFNISKDTIGYNSGKYKYCDYWHYQLDACFRNQVRNDQCNSIYVGTADGIDLKKLKEQPNEWQLFILQKWNETFHHLADKHGWIKIEIGW